MKKVLVVLAVAVLSVAAQANLITNNPGFDGIDGGVIPGWSQWADGVWDGGGGNGGVLALGWSNGKAIWQDSGHVALADTVYTLTARVQSRADSGGQVEGATLILQGAGWADIYRQDIWFADFGVENGTNSEWLEFSITVNMADYASHVGSTLKPAIAVRQDGRWTTYGNLYVDSMTLIPEPATVVLLGLGALASLKRRKA